MRWIAMIVALAALAGCGGSSGSCPNPPDCSKGKPCGCSCIAKSKTCNKAEDGSEWAASEDILDDDNR